MRPWTGHFSSPKLSFLIYETGLITWKIIKELIRKELQNVE